MKLLIFLIAVVYLELTSSHFFIGRDRSKEKNILKDNIHPFPWHKSSALKARSVTVKPAKNTTGNESANNYEERSFESVEAEPVHKNKKRSIQPVAMNDPYPIASGDSLFFKMLSNDYRQHHLQKPKGRKKRDSDIEFLDIGFDKISNNPWKIFTNIHRLSSDKMKSKRSADQLFENEIFSAPFNEKYEAFYDGRTDNWNEASRVIRPTVQNRYPKQNGCDVNMGIIIAMNKTKVLSPDLFNITFSIMREISIFDDMFNFFKTPKFPFFDPFIPVLQTQTPRKLRFTPADTRKSSTKDLFDQTRAKRQAHTEITPIRPPTLDTATVSNNTGKETSVHTEETSQPSHNLTAERNAKNTTISSHNNNSTNETNIKSDSTKIVSNATQQVNKTHSFTALPTNDSLRSVVEQTVPLTKKSENESDLDETTYLNLKTLYRSNKSLDPNYVNDLTGQYSNVELDESQAYGNNENLFNVMDNDTQGKGKSGKSIAMISLGVLPGIVGVILILGAVVMWAIQKRNLQNNHSARVTSTNSPQSVIEAQALPQQKPVQC